jgi:hypothetical protein
MNKGSEYPEVARLYKAKFDNYPEPIPHSFAGSPLKHASALGATQELEQAMRDAIHSGKPMDFNAFATMLNERSAGAAKLRPWSSEAEGQP